MTDLMVLDEICLASTLIARHDESSRASLKLSHIPKSGVRELDYTIGSKKNRILNKLRTVALSSRDYIPIKLISDDEGTSYNFDVFEAAERLISRQHERMDYQSFIR